MDNPSVFMSFVKNPMIFSTPGVRDIIIRFADTFTTMISYPDEDIDSSV